METTEPFRGLACTACGETFDPGAAAGRCPDCDAPLDPTYDYDAASLDRGEFAAATSQWALADAGLLPFPADEAVTADEGATPLVAAESLAADLGVSRLLIKDEARNPTGTVLDRGLSVAVTAAASEASSDASGSRSAKRSGDRETPKESQAAGAAGPGDGEERVAVASPGNGGQSLAAYAGRAGLRSYAFVPSRAPFSNKALVNVHGGEMRVVGGRYPDAREALETGLESEYRSLQEFTTPYRHEGIKTLAYELLADLDWSAPDAVVVPTGSGEVLVGVAKGLRECRTLGLVDDAPAVYAAQPEGCAPVAAAWADGRETTEPWEHPDTICGELEIPDPAGGAPALRELDATGGGAVTATDDEILESAVAVAQRETVEMGAAAGAAAAGAWNLAEAGDLGAADTVVVVNTESAAKTPDVLRSHLMGQGV